jgi:hypothetical protein
MAAAEPARTKAPEAPTPAAPIEPAAETRPAARPAQEIALRVDNPTADGKVELRVSERAGEVHVSVRTPDAELARAMREDLGSLTGKLSQSGYETAAPTNENSSFNRPHDQSRDAWTDQRNGSSGGGQQQRQQQQQQQQQQEDPRERRFAWLDNFAEMLRTEKEVR